MKDAQKPGHLSLSAVLTKLREGRYVIPDFQREFEWEPWDIRDLMRSIFLDYYIGSLLLWKGKKQNFEALSCERIYGYEDSSDQRDYIVLDGQQRLTAIFYALVAPNKPLPNRKNAAFYYIRVDKFMEEEYDKAFHYEWRGPYWNSVLETPRLQFEQHIFPLRLISRGGFQLLSWIQEYKQFWLERAAQAEAAGDAEAAYLAREYANGAMPFGEHVNSISEQYQVSFIELDQDLELDKVCDIFTKLNSKGVRLDVFDLMNALLRPKQIYLKERWRKAEERLAFVNTDRMNVYILQVMSILVQSYCSPKYLYYLMPGQEKPIRYPDGSRDIQVLVPRVGDFEKLWDRAVDALDHAIQLLRQPQAFGAIRSDFLPYASILPVFASLQAYISQLPPNQRLNAQTKFRHWYWAAVFTNRYSGSVESTSARDFQDLQRWIENEEEEPPLIGEFKARVRDMNLRGEVRRGNSVYNGVFNLLVINGARDFISGNIPQAEDLDDHHIVPAAWCNENLVDISGSTILNRTPITAETNRKIIRDRLPNQYLPELIEANGEQAVREVLDSHLISRAAQAILMRAPFTPADFVEFIMERQRSIQEAIENLLVKERIDLPPALRALDERIERVELGLRALILEGLENDVTRVPSHIAQKVEERVQSAIRKGPVPEPERLGSLEGRLEYFDLRDLEATLLNGTLWPSFSPRLNDCPKPLLQTRFSQLAELRNGIRHSRSVPDVTRMEGEAAIIWFEQVLRV